MRRNSKVVLCLNDLGIFIDDLPGKNYILAALPENYRLYEHVKFTTSETTGEFLE